MRSLRVLHTTENAKGTLEVHLEKPKAFTFRAGQAVYVTLGERAQGDARGAVRTFSIASAPHEEDLVLTTRVSDSSFKQQLVALAAGTSVSDDGAVW